MPEIPTDVQLLLQVKNHGSKPTYFSIIDIQPDGVINPILPLNGVMTKEECKLEPYESKIIPGYFVMLYPPYGLETFKIFSSQNPIDLSPIISQRGEATRGSRGGMEALEQLLQDSYSSKHETTRGGSLVYSSQGGSGTAKSTVFRIVEPAKGK